jgi:hypothetical protein
MIATAEQECLTEADSHPQRLLNLYWQWQDELRADNGRRASDLMHELHVVMRHLPWEAGRMHDLHYHQVHELAYPDPKTRPERLDVIPMGHNPLIDEYEIKRQAG